MSKGKRPPGRLPGDASVADMHAAFVKRMGKTPASRSRGPEAQQAVRESLSVPNPTDRSEQLSTEMEGLIQLRISDVQPYDRNPRRHANERYEDIKNSIRVSSVLAPIVVTKRPGSNQYMVAAGGNTRLRAQQELWAETGDPRFEYMLGMYRPWVSELNTLVSHLAENELRGNLSFWDRACGVLALKEELEAAGGKPLSLRQCQEQMEARGLRISIWLLSIFGFAGEQLEALGAATARLNQTVARDLQPAFQQLQRYLQFRGEDGEWRRLRDAALKSQVHLLSDGMYKEKNGQVEEAPRVVPLEPDRLIAAIERAVAAHLDEPIAEVRIMRTVIEQNPKASNEELRMRRLEAARRGPTAPAAAPPVTVQADVVSADDESGEDEDVESAPGAVAAAVPAPAKSATRSARPQADPAVVEAEAADADVEDDESPIIAFARACGVADLLRECPALPHGYFMEVPPDGAFLDGLDGNEVHPLRHGGWWIAAMYSGQLDGADAELLPKNSLWRQLQLMEAGHDETAYQWHVETALGNPPDLRELGAWLLHCPAHVLDAHDRLVRALRAAKQ